jgi:Flp pilus assembly protein TadB
VITIALIALAVLVGAVPLRPRPRRDARVVERAPGRLVGLAQAWTTQRKRHRKPQARAVAAWCDDVARRVRSGSTLRDAVTVLPIDGATEQATSALRLAIERGLSIDDAVDRVDNTGPHLRLALGVIATAGRIGGPSAASIDRTAMLLRQRAADLDERATQAAQARLSSHVMTAVPLVMLALLVATDDDVRSVATSPTGAICIGAGLTLNAIGWWWMRHIVGVTT